MIPVCHIRSKGSIQDKSVKSVIMGPVYCQTTEHIIISMFIALIVSYTLISCSKAMIVPSDNISNNNHNNSTITSNRRTQQRPSSGSSTVGKVLRLRLMSANKDNNNGKRLIDPLSNGTNIDTSKFPTRQFFNVQAIVSGVGYGPIGSIGFTLKRGSTSSRGSVTEYRAESVAPFSLCGDVQGLYSPCQLLLPSKLLFTITATPYELPNLKGIAGVTRTVQFTMFDGSVVLPLPVPVPSPVVPPTLTSSVWKEVDNDAPLHKRHEACFLMVGRKAYLLAGRNINPVNIYDPVTREWTQGQPPPISIHHTQCVAVDKSIWMVSSWTGGYPQETNNDLIYVSIFSNHRYVYML